MSFLRHLFVALIYATVAVATPRLLPGIDIRTGPILGGVILLCCAMLHEVFARHIQQAHQADDFHELRDSHDEITRELILARGEVGNIHEALTKFRGAKDAN